MTAVTRMTYSMVAVATLVFVLSPLTSLATERINVRESATVTTRTIMVGDVAELTGFSVEEKTRVASLRFGNAPQPDTDATFSARQVKGRLYNAGVDVKGCDLEIPDKITIHRKASIVTGREIIDAAVGFLRKNIIWDQESIEISVVKTPMDVVLPYGDVKVEFTMDSRPKKYGVHNFRADIVRNGKTVRVLSLTTYLEVKANVVVASDVMKAGHVISEDDLAFERIDLTTLRPGAYDSKEKLIGKRVFRRVSSDELITHSNVEIVPDVDSGQMVTLVIRYPGFEVAAQGKALHKGYVGESIKVLNLQSKKVLHGIVIDAGTVEVTGP